MRWVYDFTEGSREMRELVLAGFTVTTDDRHHDRAAEGVLRRQEDRGHVDLFSFGTNDRTQTALGFSRDDGESAFMPVYIERRIVERSPFETIDEPGVGWLVRLAAWVAGRPTRASSLGSVVSREEDPDSIDFFHRAWLDDVSGSPYRLPVARVAAAQAAIRHPANQMRLVALALPSLR